MGKKKEDLNPYYFRLLVALISLEEKGDFQIPLSDSETQFLARKLKIGPTYGPRLLGGGYKGRKDTPKTLEIDTINKLVYYLTPKYGYQNWDDFKEIEYHEEMHELPWKTYYEIKELLPTKKERIDIAIRENISNKIAGANNLDFDLKEKERAEDISKSDNLISPESDGFSNDTFPKTKKKTQNREELNIKKSLLAFGSLAIILFIYFVYSEAEFSGSASDINVLDSLDVLQVVKDGMDLELEAYKAVPNHEQYLDSLKLIFGEAPFSVIQKILTSSARKNWILTNSGNPSFNLLHQRQIDSVEYDSNNIANMVYISTLEKWKIQWFNSMYDEYEYMYDVLNEQKYVLEKQKEGGWLILSNEYAGNKPKEIPQQYDCSFFEKSLESYEQTEKKLWQHFLAGEIENTLTLLRCYTIHKKQFENLHSDVELLVHRYRNLQRYLNLEKMEVADFSSEKTTIAEKTKNIIEELIEMEKES